MAVGNPIGGGAGGNLKLGVAVDAATSGFDGQMNRVQNSVSKFANVLGVNLGGQVKNVNSSFFELKRMFYWFSSYAGFRGFHGEIDKTITRMREMEKQIIRITNLTGSKKFGASSYSYARTLSARLGYTMDDIMKTFESVTTEFYLDPSRLNTKALSEVAQLLGTDIAGAVDKLKSSTENYDLWWARMGVGPQEYARTVMSTFGIQNKFLALQDLVMRHSTGRADLYANSIDAWVNRIGQFFSSLRDQISMSLLPLVKDLLKQTYGFLIKNKEFFVAIANFVVGFVRIAWHEVEWLLGLIFKPLEKYTKSAPLFFKSVLGPLLVWLEVTAFKARTAILDFWNGFKEPIKATWSFIKETWSTAFVYIKDALTKAGFGGNGSTAATIGALLGYFVSFKMAMIGLVDPLTKISGLVFSKYGLMGAILFGATGGNPLANMSKTMGVVKAMGISVLALKGITSVALPAMGFLLPVLSYLRLGKLLKGGAGVASAVDGAGATSPLLDQYGNPIDSAPGAGAVGLSKMAMLGRVLSGAGVAFGGSALGNSIFGKGTKGSVLSTIGSFTAGGALAGSAIPVVGTAVGAIAGFVASFGKIAYDSYQVSKAVPGILIDIRKNTKETADNAMKASAQEYFSKLTSKDISGILSGGTINKENISDFYDALKGANPEVQSRMFGALNPGLKMMMRKGSNTVHSLGFSGGDAIDIESLLNKNDFKTIQSRYPSFVAAFMANYAKVYGTTSDVYGKDFREKLVEELKKPELVTATNSLTSAIEKNTKVQEYNFTATMANTSVLRGGTGGSAFSSNSTAGLSTGGFFSTWVSALSGMVNHAIPSFDTGGHVGNSGLAYVHSGEYVASKEEVSRALKSVSPMAVSQGGNVFNFTFNGDVTDKEDLKEQIMEAVEKAYAKDRARKGNFFGKPKIG